VWMGLGCVYHPLIKFQGLELIQCADHRLVSEAKSRVNDCSIALREEKLVKWPASPVLQHYLPFSSLCAPRRFHPRPQSD
jgi:hypothetical protein